MHVETIINNEENIIFFKVLSLHVAARAVIVSEEAINQVGHLALSTKEGYREADIYVS